MNNLRFLPFVLIAAALTPACGGDSDPVFRVSWYIQDVGVPLNDTSPCCEEAGATTVEFVARNYTTGMAYPFTFACGGYDGQTPVLPEGDYTITMRLLNVAGEELDTRTIVPPAGRAFVSLRGPTNLGTVPFQVNSLFTDWQIIRRGTPGPALSCAQVGASQVKITATLGASPPLVYQFPCETFQGTTQAVARGTYEISAQLITPGGVVLDQRANTYTVRADLPSDLGLLTFEVN